MRLFSKKDTSIKKFDELKAAIRKIIKSTVLRNFNIDADYSSLSAFEACNTQVSIERFLDRLGEIAALPSARDSWGDLDSDYDDLREEGRVAINTCWGCVQKINDFSRKTALSEDDKIQAVKSEIKQYFIAYIFDAKLRQEARKNSPVLSLSFMRSEQLPQYKIDAAEDVIFWVEKAKSLGEIKLHLSEYQKANNACEKWNPRGNGLFGKALADCFESIQNYASP